MVLSFPSTRTNIYSLRSAWDNVSLASRVSNDTLFENSPAGTVIGTLSCTGVVGVPVYTLVDSSFGQIKLTGTNNATVVAGATPVDREQQAYINFTVSIDGISPSLPDQTFTVDVIDVSEFAPIMVGGATAAFSIPENSTVVTTILATDADATAVVTYSIAGGADAAKFSIDPHYGTLAFINRPDFEAPGDADADNQYVVVVRASDGVFAATQTVTVTVTDVVEPFLPINTILPLINVPAGGPALGGTLSVTDGTWTALPAPTYAYRWLRNGVVQSGQTSNTYVLTLADVSSQISAIVTATNIAGSTDATSLPVGPVAVPPSLPASLTPPVISGTLIVGNTLSVTTGVWDGNPAPTYAYSWRNNGTAIIPPATASTYLLVSADAAAMIDCVVTATNAVGSANATAVAVGPIVGTESAPVNVILPAITGPAVADGVLTAGTGAWTGTPTPTYTYQWIRLSDPNTDAGVPVNIGLPSVSGAPDATTVNSVLTAATGTWIGDAPITYTYQWTRT